jgi:hypothetical protein
MIDSTHLKAHRTVASLLKKGPLPACGAHERRVKLETPCRFATAMESHS